MPVSPQDFAFWARATGNKYPETPEEKAAAAPHAHAFARGFARGGENAPHTRVGGTIFYDNPVAHQNTHDNSLFNAPVTPDNQVPKVAGTNTPTLTSQHFINQEVAENEDRQRQHSWIDTLGKTALVAGGVAAAAALGSNPSVQQAVRSAASSIKQNAATTRGRVSNFLRGIGGGRVPDPDVVRNSGDVTPPPPGANQVRVPEQSQEVQVAKGAPTGSVSESGLHMPGHLDPYSHLERHFGTAEPTLQEQLLHENVQKTGARNIANAINNLYPSPWEEHYEPQVTSEPQTVADTKFSNFKKALAEKHARALPPGKTPAAPATARSAIATGQLQGVHIGGGILHDLSKSQQTTDPSVPVTGVTTASAEQFKSPTLDLGEQTSGIGALEGARPPGSSFRTPKTMIFDTLKKLPSGQEVIKSVGVKVPSWTPETEEGLGTLYTGRAVAPSTIANAPQYTFHETPLLFGLRASQLKEPPREVRDVTSGYLNLERNVNRLPSMVSDIPGSLSAEQAIAQWEQQHGQEDPFSGVTDVQNMREGYLLPKHIRYAEKQAAKGSQPVIEKVRAFLSGETGMPEHPDRRVNTARRQAIDIFNATGDISALEHLEEGALPLNVTLATGHTVPTKAFYAAFGPTTNPETGEVVADTAEQRLIGAQRFRNAVRGVVKTNIAKALGVGEETLPHFPTQKMLKSLPDTPEVMYVDNNPNLPNEQRGKVYTIGEIVARGWNPDKPAFKQQFTKIVTSQRSRAINTLRSAQAGIEEAEKAVQRARDFAHSYGLTEAGKQGMHMKPILPESLSPEEEGRTDVIIGARLVPEQEGLTPKAAFERKSRMAVGRQQIGGVGRGIEAAQEAFGESPTELTQLLATDPDELSFVRDVDTNEIHHVDDLAVDVLQHGLRQGHYVPIAQGRTSPSTVLQAGYGRSYKGVGPEQIDPSSFIAEGRHILEEGAMDRYDPTTGLFYSHKAMERPSGRGDVEVYPNVIAVRNPDGTLRQVYEKTTTGADIGQLEEIHRAIMSGEMPTEMAHVLSTAPRSQADRMATQRAAQAAARATLRSQLAADQARLASQGRLHVDQDGIPHVTGVAHDSMHQQQLIANAQRNAFNSVSTWNAETAMQGIPGAMRGAAQLPLNYVGNVPERTSMAQDIRTRKPAVHLVGYYKSRGLG